jgi:hypothetical protein
MNASSIERARGRVTALVALLAVCSTLVACGADAPAKAQEKKPPQPILTQKSWVRVWKDYDQVNNSVLPKAGPPAYDGSAYAVADTGPLLDLDVTGGKLARINHAKGSKPFTHRPDVLYAPLEKAGFALGTTKPSASARQLNSLVPVDGQDSWKQEMNVWLTQPKAVPTPLPPGTKTQATASDVQRVRTALRAVTAYWTTLLKPSDVSLGQAKLMGFATDQRSIRAGKLLARSDVDVSTYQTPGAGEALRIVRVKGGLLALAGFRVRQRLVATKPGVTFDRSGDTAKLLGKKAGGRTDEHYVCTLALSVPDQGTAKVLGTGSVPVVK